MGWIPKLQILLWITGCLENRKKYGRIRYTVYSYWFNRGSDDCHSSLWSTQQKSIKILSNKHDTATFSFMGNCRLHNIHFAWTEHGYLKQDNPLLRRWRTSMVFGTEILGIHSADNQCLENSRIKINYVLCGTYGNWRTTFWGGADWRCGKI